MDTGVTVAIVAALADTWVIGSNGEIPWRLPNDLKWFKGITMNHPVIMGRTTYESIVRRIHKPLPNRENIVLTRNPDFTTFPEVRVAHSLSEALTMHTSGEVFVIGGAQLYREAIPLAQVMFLTRVHSSTITGDTMFPEWNESEWTLTKHDTQPADENNEHPHTFQVWRRKKDSASFVELTNARKDEQRLVMEQIQKDGVCPFCQEHLLKYHKLPIIKQTPSWILTENQWPYENTRVHLLTIMTRHIENITELTPSDWSELGELTAWAQQHYALEAGGLAIRFGDTRESGATVRHLHAHIITANITDRKHAEYKPVRFRIG